jgi:feruloyl esterase
LASSAVSAVAQSPDPGCERLSALPLAGGRITRAQQVAAGGYTAAAGNAAPYSSLPAFCRVEATLTPSPDSDIKIEVWLPQSGWNQKLQAVGNNGWGGAIVAPALADALRRGYAAAATDTGHVGGAAFAIGHPQKLVDYAHRAVHEMTVAAKAIVDSYYRTLPVHSYFNGCSAGGRQALEEAQRYPQDFDGIIAGAPAANLTGRATQAVAVAQAVHRDDASFLPPDKLKLIHDAVLLQCDALDGVKDGVLENPQQCGFDPKALECKAGDASGCLTAPQVESARTMYAPVRNSRTGQQIFPGFSVGSENGWATMAGPQPFAVGVDYFKYVLFGDPNWDYRTLNYDSHMALVEKAEAGDTALNALNPDLKSFFDRGGKLLQYHGWADPQISSMSSVEFHGNVLQRTGAAARDSYRLFMVPGMAHCTGGDGTSDFDMTAALEEWVERSHAPDRIPAARVVQGRVERTRPLCSYPQVATYAGKGSTDDAANFVCKVP